MLRGRPASEPRPARTAKKTDENAAPQTPVAEAPAPAPADSERVPLSEVMPKPGKKGGKGAKPAKGSGSAKPSAKAATGAKSPAKKAKTAAPKKASGLDLAAKVLAESKEPLTVKAITERAVAAGWKSDGKTPHATLAAAIGREIKDKGRDSRFKKTGRGLFIANKDAKAD